MQKPTFNPYNQDEILLGIKINDPEVLKWLYQSQYPKIAQFVRNNNGDEDQAKDLFQEAFIAVWKNVKEEKFIPGNTSTMTGYLFQIAKNKWLDFLRSSKYKKTVHFIAKHEKQEENEEGQTEDLLRKMAIEIENLGENCREILRRFYFSKESMETIAHAFGWTEATARNSKYRCIQRLKEKMK